LLKSSILSVLNCCKSKIISSLLKLFIYSMIQFLKESTFAVNEVFNKSVDLLKNNYFSVAGLCLLLFITSNLSSTLAVYFKDINIVLSLFMALFFAILYFGINLSLFKYILHLIDKDEKVRVSDTFPSTKELSTRTSLPVLIYLPTIP